MPIATRQLYFFGTGEDNQLNYLLLIDISSAVRVAQSSAEVFVPLIKMYQQKPFSYAVAPYGRCSKGELHSSLVKYECVIDAPHPMKNEYISLMYM